MRTLGRVLIPAAAVLAGCVAGPRAGNPVAVPARYGPAAENPALVAPSLPDPAAYANLFETVLAAVSEYFPIANANRYSGQIDTLPITAPGVAQPWRPGSPDPYERLLATTQSIRYRGEARISPAPEGGYLVEVRVYKELEDVPPRPVRAVAGNAAFRSFPTVERQFQVIDPAVVSPAWIPQGRADEIEQAILDRIRRSQ